MRISPDDEEKESRTINIKRAKLMILMIMIRRSRIRGKVFMER